MEGNSFWLAEISNTHLSVALVIKDQKYHVAAIGPSVQYSSIDNFVNAVDTSLSSAAESARIPPESEPDAVALIIPPFWVGADGKIVSDKLKFFEILFKELKLKPMGFISFDEAVVEDTNMADGFPSSFVLVNFGQNYFSVSLTYLGKIIERQIKQIAGEFIPSMLETALIDFKSESTLPPQIVITGNFSSEDVDKIKSYPWIGKKSIETFLHFPDIKTYSKDELTGIFMRVITSQFSPPSPGVRAPDVKKEESVPEVVPVDELSTPEITDEPEHTAELSEVSPDDLGFITADNFTVPEVEPEIPAASFTEEPEIDDEVKLPEVEEPSFRPVPPEKSFKTPTIKLPKFRFPKSNFFLLPIALLPLLILIPFYFSKASVSLLVTPYTFSKTISATFDPLASDVDLSKNILPINKQSYDIATSATVAVTGQKTVGDKSQGEITVFNKQDKVQSLPKGAVLTDSQGKKFELSSSVQVASSSSDLANGVITLGKTKVMVVASDIGPEFNLPKDSILKFKDFSESVLVARVGEGLSGGSKKQIQAVEAKDKVALEKELTTVITDTLESKLSEETKDRPSIISDLTFTKKGRIDYSREVGEEADELEGSVNTAVTLFFFDSTQKQKIITKLFSSEPGFSELKINPDDFIFKINSAKKSNERPSAQVEINGKAIPKIDSQSLAKLLSGKTMSKAQEVIKKNVPRAYNYQIQRNLSFLNFINPMPFLTKNITIEVK